MRSSFCSSPWLRAKCRWIAGRANGEWVTAHGCFYRGLVISVNRLEGFWCTGANRELTLRYSCQSCVIFIKAQKYLSF